MSTEQLTRLEHVRRDAMALSGSDRIDLAIELWHSVHGAGDIQETEEDRQALLAMLRERIRQIDEGEVECVPFEEAMRQAPAGVIRALP